MSVRLKFVLLITLFVSLIFLLSFFVIYFLYARTRQDDYNRRIWAHAYQEYTNYYQLSDTDNRIKSKLAYYLPGTLVNFKVTILDSNYRVVYSNPILQDYKVDTARLLTIHEIKESHFNIDDSQAIGLYIDDFGKPAYIIASGYDKFGVARLATLRKIIFTVAIGGILIIGVFALYTVFLYTKPLVELSNQMRDITENNLKLRVFTGANNSKKNELTQIAHNFNNMLDRLDNAFSLQKNFVHHASHELRTPLATMLSQTESALRKDLTTDEAKRVLESLKEDQQEMIDLTNSLLLLSQYENISAATHHSWPVIRIDELLYDAVASAQKTFSGIEASFDFVEIPANEHYLYLKGNEALLRSAFRNLVKNAYTYSDNKKVDITMLAPGNFIHIYFENSGPLLNAEDSDRLFLPFFRGENAMKKKGFGLGLSIVKRIIELHKGSIRYEIKDEKVNRFTISFSLQGSY